MGEEHGASVAQKDVAVEYIRVVSMAMIVLCHILQYYGNQLAYWFNVGVQIFLIISGFLYGGREIADPLTFIGKRFKKILVPYYVFLIPTSVCYFLFASDSINLALFVKALFGAEVIRGIQHLWFVPYILFCYLITPLLQAVRKRIETLSFMRMTVACLSLMGMYAVLALLFDSFFAPNHIVCYLFGYFLAVYYTRYGRRFMTVLGMILVPLGAAVNAVKVYLTRTAAIVDGTRAATLFANYERLSHILLGVALFLLMYAALQKAKPLRVVSLCGEYSYSVYIVHLAFLFPPSPLCLMTVTPIPLVNVVLALAATVVSAVALGKISSLLERILLPYI